MRFWAPRFFQHGRSPVPCPRYTDPVASKLIWWTGIVDTKPRPRLWAPPLPIHGTPSPKLNTIYNDEDDEIVGVLDLLSPSPFCLSLVSVLQKQTALLDSSTKKASAPSHALLRLSSCAWRYCLENGYQNQHCSILQ
jgi:hypothetical protein